jgi:hypothetical protein
MPSSELYRKPAQLFDEGQSFIEALQSDENAQFSIVLNVF